MARQTADQKKKVAERRRRVWELRLVRKLPIAQIADALGVDEKTIDRDLAEVQQQSSTLFMAALEDEAAPLLHGMVVCEELDALLRQAWSDIVSAAPGSSERSRFLTVVLAAIQARAKILQSLGLLQKVAEDVLVHRGDPVSALTDAELDDAIAFFVEAAARGETPATRPVAASEPDTVDRGRPPDSE
jgi:hypothetical protein